MKTVSLAAAGTALAAGGTAIGMVVYAVLQYARHPELAAGRLALEHAIHVAFLMAPIYLAMLVGFHVLLLRPIRKLESELYRVATGHSGSVSLGSRVRELKAVERAANLMVQRIDMNAKGAAGWPDAELAALAAVAGELQSTSPEVAERILGASSELRHAIASFKQRQVAPDL